MNYFRFVYVCVVYNTVLLRALIMSVIRSPIRSFTHSQSPSPITYRPTIYQLLFYFIEYVTEIFLRQDINICRVPNRTNDENPSPQCPAGYGVQSVAASPSQTSPTYHPPHKWSQKLVTHLSVSHKFTLFILKHIGLIIILLIYIYTVNYLIYLVYYLIFSLGFSVRSSCSNSNNRISSVALHDPHPFLH